MQQRQIRFRSVVILLYSLICTATASSDTTAVPPSPRHPASPSPPPPSLDTLVIEGKRQQKTSDFTVTSVTTIDSATLLNMPGSVNDLNRILASHPSILSIGTFDNNALYVRGGNPTENVYVIDGIPFDDINHFPLVNRPGGAFGFIDPDMIDRLNIYAGGSPADLPSRTSSAIDIHLRNGARDRFHAATDISLLGLGFSGEGPLPAGAGSYLLNMRFADLRLLKYLNEDIGMPRYGDGLFKCTVDLGKAGSLQLHAVGSFDTFRGPPGEPAEGYEIDNVSRIKSNIEAGAVTWKKTAGDLSSTLLLVVSRTEFERARVYTGSEFPLVLSSHSDSIYNYQDSTQGYNFNSETLSDRRIYTRGTRKKNFYAKEDFTFPFGEQVDLGVGFSAEMHRIHFHNQYGIRTYDRQVYFRADTLFPEPDIFSDTSGGFDTYNMVDSKQTAAYLQAAIHLGPVTLIPGVRTDYFSLPDRGGLSPRLGIEFENDALGTIALTGSSIRQLPTDFDLILEYLVRNRDENEAVAWYDLRLQHCVQGALHYGRTIGTTHTFGIEAYAKRYDQQYKRYAPERRELNLYTEWFNGKTLLHLNPADGEQRVYGCEASLSTSGKQRLFYAAAGTWSISRDKYRNGSWYTDNYGRCLKGSLLAGFSFSKAHVLTANFLAMTGRWYPKIGPWYYYEDGVIVRSDSPYAGRLDPVYSLSARYTFSHQFKRCTAGGYLEAVNILNKKQVIDRQTDHFGYLDHRMLGIIPNLALMLTF